MLYSKQLHQHRSTTLKEEEFDEIHLISLPGGEESQLRQRLQLEACKSETLLFLPTLVFFDNDPLSCKASVEKAMDHIFGLNMIIGRRDGSNVKHEASCRPMN